MPSRFEYLFAKNLHSMYICKLKSDSDSERPNRPALIRLFFLKKKIKFTFHSQIRCFFAYSLEEKNKQTERKGKNCENVSHHID